MTKNNKLAILRRNKKIYKVNSLRRFLKKYNKKNLCSRPLIKNIQVVGLEKNKKK